MSLVTMNILYENIRIMACVNYYSWQGGLQIKVLTMKLIVPGRNSLSCDPL